MYFTFGGTSGSTASATTTIVCSEEHIKALQENVAKDSNHAYEGLMSLLQGMLRRMDSMTNTRSHLPRVHQVWVRKDETIQPLKGSGLT
jgi:hypothetical protein